MDSDERWTELKKAFASAILNTTKEAAARMVVSERKALRLEFELKSTKEDAIQMLVRLKQLMDSKLSEAEMISQTQQNKIEELEAQLQEAEDIVEELREDLRAAQAELEAKHTVQVNEASENQQDQSNIRQRICNALVPFRNSIDDQDLPSIILRSKGTNKRYRSGITQRILACRNEENGIFSPDRYQLFDEMDHVVEVDPCLTFPGLVNWVEVCDLCQGLDKEDHVVEGNDSRLTSQEFGNRSVDVCDVYKRINKAMELVGCEKTKLPLEVQVDPVELRGSRVIKHTFQRKRKRGVLVNGGNVSSDNLKNKEENANACSELEKVNSTDKSTQADTQEAAQQLMSLAGDKRME